MWVLGVIRNTITFISFWCNSPGGTLIYYDDAGPLAGLLYHGGQRVGGVEYKINNSMVQRSVDCFFPRISRTASTFIPGNKNESGFRPPLCTYRLNWARRTSWGWWDDWDDTVLQTQDSKFEPWRSEAEHATSRSRRLPTILTFTRGWGRNNFVSFKPPRPGTEPRTLAWKAAVLTTTLGPPPFIPGFSANTIFSINAGPMLGHRRRS